MPNRRILSVRIEGEAQPAGSKNSYVPLDANRDPYWKGPDSCWKCHGKANVRRCTGCTPRIIVNTVDSCKKSPAWKKTVGHALQVLMYKKQVATVGKLPLKLVLRIDVERPQSHFGTGRNSKLIKDSAPRYPISDPDLTKLIRAIEDGMQGIAYENDSVIVQQNCLKQYGEEAGVDVELWSVDW